MKTVCTLIVSAFLSINLMAGNPIDHPDKYCAKVKDGVKTIMHEGNPITGEVILSNGTKIQTDGTVINPDGSKTILREGQCISKEGTIVTSEKEKKTTTTTTTKAK